MFRGVKSEGCAELVLGVHSYVPGPATYAAMDLPCGYAV